MKNTAIKISNLTKQFPRSYGYRDLLPWKERAMTMALQGISLDVAEGELFGLLGPNGAGKTTLIKILCGLILPNSGEAWVFGHSVQKEEQAVRSLIGVVSSDERSFYWRLTGKQNLDFYASLYRVPQRDIRNRIEEVLKVVGLQDEANVRFQNYSTGMRQKLAIARGLLCHPRVLFMDEPTRSLDPISARAVRELIKQQVDDIGTTIILATHNMEEAESICDRVAIIDKGRLITSGWVHDLRSIFVKQKRCELKVGNMPDISTCDLSLIEGVDDCLTTSVEDDITHLNITFSNQISVLPQVLKQIIITGGDIYDCHIVEVPLEEIFVQAIDRGVVVGSQLCQ